LEIIYVSELCAQYGKTVEDRKIESGEDKALA
jgi:hypothetical protein